MTEAMPTARASGSVPSLVARIYERLEGVSYTWLALPLRLAAATVFWRSGTNKLSNWDTTLFLFADEYKVPVLPPEIAAYMATAVELSTPVLLMLGLLTRPAAFVLLAMTAVIQVFVYPQAWPTHIQWVAMLLVLLTRGAGTLSLDHFFQKMTRFNGTAAQ